MLSTVNVVLICAVLFVAWLSCVATLSVIAAHQWQLARLENWAEHAIGCWPDGCNFDVPPMPERKRQ
jgi:hypothetical protein